MAPVDEQEPIPEVPELDIARGENPEAWRIVISRIPTHHTSSSLASLGGVGVPLKDVEDGQMSVYREYGPSSCPIGYPDEASL